MSFWNTLKQKLRSFIPVSRTYMDNKLRELEKMRINARKKTPPGASRKTASPCWS